MYHSWTGHENGMIMEIRSPNTERIDRRSRWATLAETSGSGRALHPCMSACVNLRTRTGPSVHPSNTSACLCIDVLVSVSVLSNTALLGLQFFFCRNFVMHFECFNFRDKVQIKKKYIFLIEAIDLWPFALIQTGRPSRHFQCCTAAAKIPLL